LEHSSAKVTNLLTIILSVIHILATLSVIHM